MRKHFYLFGAIALPLLMAGCSNDLLDVENNGQELVDGKTVKIGKDFRLFADRAGSSEQTRGEWINPGEGTRFYWMPEGVVTAQVENMGAANDHSKTTFTVTLPVTDAQDVNLKFDEVGLCWLGNETGENILTNYKFVHDGWLADGEDSMADKIVECDTETGKYLTTWNWVKYAKDVATYGSSAANYAAEGKGVEVNPKHSGQNKVTGKLSTAVNAYDQGTWKSASNKKTIQTVNLSKGTFRTDNKSIFTGKYLAYYPYDETMVAQGKLQAKTFTRQTAPVNYVDRMLDAGKYTFMAGCMKDEIKGGSVASALTMNPVSGLLSIEANKSKLANDKIQHLVVLSAKKQIVSTLGLNASDVAKSTDEAVKNAEVTGKTQKIIVDFQDKDGAAANLTFDNYNTLPLPGNNTSTYNRVIVPMLPGTISDLDLMWIDVNGKAKITSATQNVTIPAAKAVTLNPDAYNYQTYVAWDLNSLKNALANAGNETGKQTVVVLDKIVVDEDIDIPGNVTVTGWWRESKVGELVVAASNNATDPNVLTAKKGSTVNLDLTIEGVGCCKKIAGVLNAQGFTYAAKNTLKNYGLVQFTTVNKELVENNINGNVENTPLKYVAGETIEPSTDVVYQLAFETKDFDAYDFAENPKSTTTSTTYNFQGSVIAISTLASVNINGTLNNNTSSNQKGDVRKDALIILEKRDKAVYPDNNQDARLVINEKGAIDNFATMHNQGTVANNSGSKDKLKNEVHATFVNMIGGQLNGYKMLKDANSNFIAQVDNSVDSRYQTALNEHLANIIEILPVNAAYSQNDKANWYPMSGISNTDLKYVINADNVILYGKSGSDKSPVSAKIGAIEVKDGKKGFKINTQEAGHGITPVSLDVAVTNYNETHKDVEGILTNKIYDTNLPAIYVGKTNENGDANFQSLTSQMNNVTLNVEGDVNFYGKEYIGYNGTNLPVLTVKGDLNVFGGSVCTFEPMVVKGTIDGNMNIKNGGRINFLSDVKVKVGKDENSEKGVITNNGTFNIETMTIIKSPAIVYCKKYNTTGGTWLNGGRPTPFDAGGVIPGDYAW